MTAIATQTAVELLHCRPETAFAQQALNGFAAAAQTAGIALTTPRDYHTHYPGAVPWIVLWGPGHPDRVDILRHHRRLGGHVIAVDLAYWDRAHKVRVSIDAAHPQAWVMTRQWPRTRWQDDHVGVRDDAWDPDGPMLVAGIGLKAKAQYGAMVDRWEAEMTAACHARWPDRPLVYRPKPRETGHPIEDVLAGCSLLITWHSNVAVDAIRMGIPVICRDGAPAAVCPSGLSSDPPSPLSADVRDRFLINLAWFQWGWAPIEAQGCWTFLQELLS